MRNSHRAWRAAAVAAWCCLSFGPVRQAAAQSPEAPPGERVASLIRDLGATGYDERQRASEELARLGAVTRLQLERALDSPDAEIRLHALALLNRLKVAELWAPTLVDYRAEGEPASRTLLALAEQSGNRVLMGDQYGAFHDAAVTLDFQQAPFWHVVDELCRQSGNQLRQQQDARAGGLVFVEGQTGQNPLAYAGPVRARIDTARRQYIEEFNYDSGRSEITHNFQINLQAMWEDRFRLVAYRSQPEVLEAITEDGQRLEAAPQPSTWNVASAGTRQVPMCLRLDPPPTSVARLATLRLRWGLMAVGDMQTLDVVDLASTQPCLQDDVELIVESMLDKGGGRYEVAVVVNRDLVVPQPQEVLFQENAIDLFDAEGRPFRRQSQTNSLTPRGARLRLSFSGESAESKPHLLRLTYPRLRAQHDLEIVFRDVPLPVGRPE